MKNDFLKKHLPTARQLNWLLKLLFAVLIAGALYFDWRSRDNLPEIWQTFLKNLEGANWIWLLGALVLVPFNWLAETFKWHQFVARFQPFSRWQALKAVLAGVSFSLFTPNRVGEYGGRILFVKKKHRWKAVIANVVGNVAQVAVLLSAGAVGGTWLLLRFPKIGVPVELVYGLASLAAVGLMLMFAVYFNLAWFLPLLRRLPFVHHFKRFAKDIRVLTAFDRRELTEILAWAVARYAIYSLQYFLLLRFFGLEIGLLHGFLTISAVFLLQTSIPLPPVVGLLARGNIAVFAWSFFGANEISALATTFGLWIINLILPSLIGTFFIFNVNISKTLGYETDDVQTTDPGADARLDGSFHAGFAEKPTRADPFR